MKVEMHDEKFELLKKYFFNNLSMMSTDVIDKFFNYIYQELNNKSLTDLTRLKISENELILLKLSIDGATLKNSAKAMDKSTSSIKQYRNSIIKKLNANNFTHAIAIAVEQRIVEVNNTKQ